jgi:phosphatidylglycerophosphate synthase
MACLSDALDGWLARRCRVSPSLGPYADAAADFVLVVSAFSAFVLRGVYPSWTLALLGLMFLQFVLTSGSERPRYDPFGKYYGVLLFGLAGVTLAFPVPVVSRLTPVTLLGLTVVSLASRIAFLRR